MIDSNKDGQISFGKCKDWVNFAELIDSIDDFSSNYEKMLTIVSQLGFTNVGIAPTSSLGTQADLRTAFDTYDINKDGYITRTQFGDLLSFIGINIGKPRVRAKRQIQLELKLCKFILKFPSFSRCIPLKLDLFHSQSRSNLYVIADRWALGDCWHRSWRTN